MKKIIVVIAAAALAAVAANAQSYKFAHVNFQELVQLMPEMDSARVQLDAASKEAQETLQAMAQEFDNKYSQYEQKSAEWSAAIRQSKERELSYLSEGPGGCDCNRQGSRLYLCFRQFPGPLCRYSPEH